MNSTTIISVFKKGYTMFYKDTLKSYAKVLTFLITAAVASGCSPSSSGGEDLVFAGSLGSTSPNGVYVQDNARSSDQPSNSGSYSDAQKEEQSRDLPVSSGDFRSTNPVPGTNPVPIPPVPVPPVEEANKTLSCSVVRAMKISGELAPTGYVGRTKATATCDHLQGKYQLECEAYQAEWKKLCTCDGPRCAPEYHASGGPYSQACISAQSNFRRSSSCYHVPSCVYSDGYYIGGSLFCPNGLPDSRAYPKGNLYRACQGKGYNQAEYNACINGYEGSVHWDAMVEFYARRAGI